MTVEELLEDAERFLKSARLLIADDDAKSTCNRAYYAMHAAARAALLGKGETQASLAKTHSGLIAKFGEYLIKTGDIAPEYGRLLSNASNKRQIGDYTDVRPGVAEASEAIEIAEYFVAAIKQWLKNQPLDITDVR